MDNLEITVNEVHRKITNGEAFILLDVREEDEIKLVHLDSPQVRFAPMSQIARGGLEALPAAVRDPAQEVVVFCHHGVRSLQVAQWLRQQGWEKVTSMEGGVNAYALEVDPSIGRY